MVIDQLHSSWNIQPNLVADDEFTGYESVYSELDAFDKAQYDRDPQGTIEKVYDIYRSIDLVPIVISHIED